MIGTGKDEKYCVVCGILSPKISFASDSNSLDELGLLAETAGYTPKLKILLKKDRIDPAYFIGPGKAQQIRRNVVESNAEAVIFDFDLSPVQIRNLEKVLKCRIIVRTELILNIFESRARTKEAKLQVELATLLYSLPQLRHMWPHLNRITGGPGSKGPGEKQLETDKRKIQRRISKIKKDLVSVQTHRQVMRKNRQYKNRIALVGYTNAGKSSLLNTLSHSSLFTENRLFATLDPATREVWLGDGVKAMVTDTVGFLTRLPHTLIASFHATLEEVLDADLLLHVVDISNPNAREQIEAVNTVLLEISAHRMPVFYVFNKVDLLKSRDSKASTINNYVHNVVVSAKTGEGIEDLKRHLCTFFKVSIEKRSAVIYDHQGKDFPEYAEYNIR